MEALYGPDPKAYGPYRSAVEAVQWRVAERVLRLGMNVILEYGFWSKAERLDYRLRGERAGACVKLILLELPLEELWYRVSRRNSCPEPGTLPVTREELQTWWTWFEKPTTDEF
jgi:predicted kinase